MKKLSSGADSTLKNWRELVFVFFGEDSPAVAFLDERILEQGENMEVIADEGEFIQVLGRIHLGEEEDSRRILAG